MKTFIAVTSAIAGILALTAGAAYYMYKKNESEAEELEQSDEKILFCKCDTELVGINVNDKHRNKNTIIIGPAGSGKSYSFILSNLLNEKISAICVDPYGSIRSDYEKMSKNPNIKSTVEEVCKEPGVFFISGKDATGYKVLQTYNKVVLHNSVNPDSARHVVFFIDDYAKLNYIPVIERMLSNDHVHFEIAVQTLDQLKTSNQFWQTIVDKCDNVLMFGNCAESDIEVISAIHNVCIPELKQDECAFISKNLMLRANRLTPSNFV